VWVVFFGCSDLAAIAGALPDTISAAVAARGISLAILNIKASHAPFPCAPLRKIAGRLTNFGAVGLDDNLRGHHVAGGAYATAGGEAVGSQELKRLFHRRMLDHTLSGGSSPSSKGHLQRRGLALVQQPPTTKRNHCGGLRLADVILAPDAIDHQAAR
jgi:hypothetical protein